MKVVVEFEKPTKCEDCPCFYKTEGAYTDECKQKQSEINYFKSIQNPELKEKEIRNLRKCNCIDSNSYCEKQVLKAYVDSAESREKRIEELEKEIAEQKEEIAELKEHHKSVCDTLTNTHRHIREQLTKAKEIIKELIESLEVSEGEEIRESNFVKKAEQFLKEVK